MRTSALTKSPRPDPIIAMMQLISHHGAPSPQVPRPDLFLVRRLHWFDGGIAIAVAWDEDAAPDQRNQARREVVETLNRGTQCL
jgi:hypothetical protein